jgi:hypothetical protein
MALPVLPDALPMKFRSRYLLLLLALFLSSCASLVDNRFDELYGEPRSVDRLTTREDRIALAARAHNVIEQRCVLCHGCYDAPCQLNMQSAEGIERGAHKAPVYNAKRLFAARPTRLLYDADSVAGWRQEGFFPVLNERAQARDANLEGGLIARMLALKQAHPLPEGQLPHEFDLALNRDQQCPGIEEFDRYAERYPLWGMPYGLPGLAQDEQDTLLEWVAQGAPRVSAPGLSANEQQRIERWERFLNGPSNKQRLMSRYIYEHLFLANLYFTEAGDERLFFRLVRSRSAPGEPIDIIASRFPYDDPGTAPFYYRLKPLRLSILSKTHQPYALNDGRMRRYRELFLDSDYSVAELPGYDVKVAANPFVVFRDIPVTTRYRFLLDDARTFIEGFIKGPVCRGQVAVDVINDRFWVFFVDPDYPVTDQDGSFLASQADALRLPIEEKSDGLNLLTWLRYASLQKDFLKAKMAYASERLEVSGGVTLDAFWDGDGDNPNAALTVFRHFDNASVVRGLVGDKPKTAWVINYSLFERIHYLLVAGFDVYGNLRHQLYARLYMDFLRMEGEFNFLSTLPESARKAERDFWYRGAQDDVTDYITWNEQIAAIRSAIEFSSDEPKSELFDKLFTHVPTSLQHAYGLEQVEDPEVAAQLDRLRQAPGAAATLMAETSFLLLDGMGGRDDLFSLLRDSAHLNVTNLFNEQKARVPDEDRLSVVRGVIGAYPGVFFRLSRDRLQSFVDAVLQMRSEQDYARLVDAYGVRRGDSKFWQVSDAFHQRYRASSGVEYGLADYNRLENR